MLSLSADTTANVHARAFSFPRNPQRVVYLLGEFGGALLRGLDALSAQVKRVIMASATSGTSPQPKLWRDLLVIDQTGHGLIIDRAPAASPPPSPPDEDDVHPPSPHAMYSYVASTTSKKLFRRSSSLRLRLRRVGHTTNDSQLRSCMSSGRLSPRSPIVAWVW